MANISFNIFSMLNSFSAFSPISQQISLNSNSPSFKISQKQKSSPPLLTLIPVFSVIYSQCLSFIPAFLKATINGAFGLNSSNYFLITSLILHMGEMSLSLKYLQTPAKVLILSSTNFSAALASNSMKAPLSHFGCSVYHLLAANHKLLYG